LRASGFAFPKGQQAGCPDRRALTKRKAVSGEVRITNPALAWNELRGRLEQRSISPMLEYELYLPLHHNDGRPIDPAKLKNLKRRLVDEFGGLTHFRQENEGLMKIGEHTFRDRIEIVRVLASDEVSAQRYFAQLKCDLTREWGQQDFLIVSRQVTAV
jgi:hypothetical protein